MFKFEELIRGCLKNDSKSKEMIYKSFYGYLIAVILRYVKERDDAEELVNDSFIKIFKNIGQFSFPNNETEAQKAFKSWIAKISSRTAIDFLRSRKIHLYVEEVPEQQEPASSVNAITHLNVKDILKLLNALPETQRLVFNMYEIEGFSHEEIAKMLNIPESTCRVYLTRAKSKLRILYTNTLSNSYAAS